MGARLRKALNAIPAHMAGFVRRGVAELASIRTMSTTHFGFETVDEKDKARKVRGVFDSVASKYDVMNDLMSGGLHRIWKQYTVMVANLKEG